MKPYLLSLAVGLLIGTIYSLLGMRSPAPPLVALVRLLVLLLGEQALPRCAPSEGTMWPVTCAGNVRRLCRPGCPLTRPRIDPS
jgi:XapX domain-containing protein